MTGARLVVSTVKAVDELTRPEGSVVLTTDHNSFRVVRLSPLGAAVRELCRDGLALDELATQLANVFGAPSSSGLMEAVTTVVNDLQQQGLVKLSPELPSER